MYAKPPQELENRGKWTRKFNSEFTGDDEEVDPAPPDLEHDAARRGRRARVSTRPPRWSKRVRRRVLPPPRPAFEARDSAGRVGRDRARRRGRGPPGPQRVPLHRGAVDAKARRAARRGPGAIGPDPAASVGAVPPTGQRPARHLLLRTKGAARRRAGSEAGGPVAQGADGPIPAGLAAPAPSISGGAARRGGGPAAARDRHDARRAPPAERIPPTVNN